MNICRRRLYFRLCLWMGGLLSLLSGVGTASAQLWECAAAGGSAQCPKPDTTEFSCLGSFLLGDSQPCTGLGFPGPQCVTEDEALENAITNYSKLPPPPCGKPSYGPLCPSYWNPHEVGYELGEVRWVRNAYVANVPMLVEGSCVVRSDPYCGSPDIPNRFYGAIGNCVRNITCPAGSARYGDVCKTARSKVCKLGNPMDCVTGEKTQAESDITRAGSGPLEFTRYYASSGFYEPRGSGPQTPEQHHYRILGPNWRHTYQRAIQPEPAVAGQPAMMTVMRPDGDYHHFRWLGGQWTGNKDEPDTLQELVSQGQRVGWRYQSADNAVELYDADGQLQSISLVSGQILTMQYSTPSTPAATAPFEGLLIAVEDSNGRTLQLRYDALARVAKVIDADGNEHTYAYSVSNALTGVTRPGGATRTYLYNEAAHNLNYYAGTLLTGIVDENGQRYGTYRYSHNRVNEEWHGSAYADRLAITYSSGAAPPYYFARTTGALGNFEQRDLVAVAGAVKEAGRKLCATENCSSVIAESRRSYDANGNLTATVDYRGTVTDFDFNDRGQELLRRENFAEPQSCPAPSTYYSSNYGSSCATGTCWSTAPFPGSSSGAPLGWNNWYYSCLQPNGPATQTRSVETDWHAAFNVPVERRIRDAANLLEARTQWAYNSRGQVVAKCEYDAADAAAAAYVCSATVDPPPAAKVRRWTHAYCEAPDVAASNSDCPVLGYLKSSNGPRSINDAGMNGADDVTTYIYYSVTDESGCGVVGGACHRKGDQRAVIDALGHRLETVAYDRAGRPRRTRDPNGVVTDLAYDGNGRLLSRTVRALPGGAPDPQDAAVSFAYDATGLITRVTQPDGAYLNYAYDDAHRLTTVTNGLGHRIVYTLDAAGNRTREEMFDATYDAGVPGQGLRYAMAWQYNALSRIVRSMNASGGVTRDSMPFDGGGLLDGYDGAGNNVQFKNGLNVQTRQSYDALDRLTRTMRDYGGTDPQTADATTEYVYDARDNVRSIKDPDNLVTTYAYDGLGNLTALDSPDTGHSAYHYDRAGNRTGMTDGRGVTSSYSYDASGRLRAIAYPTSSLDVAFHYDEPDAATGCSGSHPLGNLTRLVDSSGVTTYCYDRQGKTTKKTQVTAGTALAVGYAYSASGRVSTMTYPSGGIASYTYDAAGRPVGLSWKSSPSAAPVTVVSSATYLPFGPLDVTTFGNGRVLTKSYDKDYIVDSVVSSAADGLAIDFGRDAAGQITSATASGSSPSSRSYVYDNLSRLTRVNDGGGQLVEDYAYNKTGDRTLKQFAGQPAQVYTYLAGTHRLGSAAGVARSYDANGNTTNRGDGVTLDYDDRNYLAGAAVPGNPTSYDYTGHGERVLKSQNSGATPVVRRYVYDEDGKLISEQSTDVVTGQLAWTEYLFLGSTVVALVRDTGVSYLETDHLGTPRIAVNLATNTKEWEWSLFDSAFGEHAAQTVAGGGPVALRYPGQWLDAETGLHYNYFRSYEATTGRYLESDPLGLDGGSSTYQYALSSPLSYLDASGLLSAKVRDCVCKNITVHGMVSVAWGAVLQARKQGGKWNDPVLRPCENYLYAYTAVTEGDSEFLIHAGVDVHHAAKYVRPNTSPPNDEAHHAGHEGAFDAGRGKSWKDCDVICRDGFD